MRNILHEIRKRKANWIGHILCRNCLLQRVTEGKIQRGIEVTGRQGKRCRKLLDDLKESRGYSPLKEEALNRIMWRVRFGRGFVPVVRRTTKRMNEDITVCWLVNDCRQFGMNCCLHCQVRRNTSSLHVYRHVSKHSVRAATSRPKADMLY
jgi:hypothetical protein